MYYLFVGYDYYPSGGQNDLRGVFSSVEEAKENLKNNCENYYGDWAHIMNSAGEKVWSIRSKNLRPLTSEDV